MKARIGQGVVAEDRLVKLMHEEVQRRERSLQDKLDELKRFRGELGKLTEKRQLIFRVHLEDLWVDQGGKSVTVECKGSLRKTFEEAIARYQQVNNRSDVQAIYHVHIVLPKVKGVEHAPVPVPEEHWKDYKFKHGK